MFVITVYDYICANNLRHSSKSSNVLNKTSSAFKQGASKQTKQALSVLCVHKINGISLEMAPRKYRSSFLSLSDIPLMLAAWSSVPNMVSIPYSKPLWLVSEEVDLDSESELTE